jgi:transposase
MIRVQLTDAERAAVQALRRDSSLHPRERDWVEMLLLADAGWSPPRIAVHLQCHPKTVRLALRRFQTAGVAGLRRQPPGPAPDLARRQQVEHALDALLAQDRTWTARQLAAALAEQDLHLSVRQTRKYLGRLARWRRTVRSLRHQQDPRRVARARTQLALLKKRRMPER